LAGNDLLILSQFGLNDEWPEQFENIKSTVLFFRDRYESDRAFRTRVDEALKRILRLKQRLYPSFALQEVLVSRGEAQAVLGQGQDLLSRLAQDAVTLVYPGPGELADRLPSPPLSDENILIVTDSRPLQECFDCEPFPAIAPQALEQMILRMYGPTCHPPGGPFAATQLQLSPAQGVHPCAGR